MSDVVTPKLGCKELIDAMEAKDKARHIHMQYSIIVHAYLLVAIISSIRLMFTHVHNDRRWVASTLSTLFLSCDVVVGHT